MGGIQAHGSARHARSRRDLERRTAVRDVGDVPLHRDLTFSPAHAPRSDRDGAAALSDAWCPRHADRDSRAAGRTWNARAPAHRARGTGAERTADRDVSRERLRRGQQPDDWRPSGDAARASPADAAVLDWRALVAGPGRVW